MDWGDKLMILESEREREQRRENVCLRPWVKSLPPIDTGNVSGPGTMQGSGGHCKGFSLGLNFFFFFNSFRFGSGKGVLIAFDKTDGKVKGARVATSDPGVRPGTTGFNSIDSRGRVERGRRGVTA